MHVSWSTGLAMLDVSLTFIRAMQRFPLHLYEPATLFEGYNIAFTK